MDMTGNTILVTGGASGIGRGLAEAFHARGNTVIVAGRRRAALDAVIHNAGIMRPEPLAGAPAWLADAEAIVDTNLTGPIRLTAALLPHLLARPKAAILTVTSGLAFVPSTAFPTYSATKAALHSWTQTLRRQLAATAVEVIEIAPPYVQTELTGPHQAVDPRAMPLADYIAEVVSLLDRAPTPPEIIVERCKGLRFAAENGKFDEIFEALAAT